VEGRGLDPSAARVKDLCKCSGTRIEYWMQLEDKGKAFVLALTNVPEEHSTRTILFHAIRGAKRETYHRD